MPIRSQFFRFAAVGASGTILQYLILWVGVRLFSIDAALASSIGYIFAAFLNYGLNYIFTFDGGQPHLTAARRYFTVLGIGWLINAGLMSILVHHLNLNYWIAQVFSTTLGLFWNFAGSKLWAFKINVSS